MSKAKLLRANGRAAEAYASLRVIYDWFTEGFETGDLKSAKSLLVELENETSDNLKKTNYSSA